jgi:hypothetical protein
LKVEKIKEVLEHWILKFRLHLKILAMKRSKDFLMASISIILLLSKLCNYSAR